MEQFDKKKHWENIYQTKELNEVSWYQAKPEMSLKLILANNPDKTTKIIDIGGGDSFLVDHLLQLGFENITVLDISSSAIDKAKKRLGKKASKVKWIVADASKFEPTEKYDIWHDRAAYHFLTQENEITNYIGSTQNGISDNGQLIIGTFSENGPTKCSGIEIKQYSEESLTKRFSAYFNKTNAEIVEHPTPFGTFQEFIFCCFIKA